ncbi:cyclin-J18 [Mangifera indica]|uniref:cyclin-J18 n=1 Tax=Mangifera indica TaxID=29780 RepID=UPI001CFA03C1|nr:cyclin-J18 [Mangifera indica]
MQREMRIDGSLFWTQLAQFLIQSAHQLEVSPIVKYTALSLFFDRFHHCLSSYTEIRNLREGNDKVNWLLQPMTQSNLQLFALISLWVSSKIHDSRPLSVKTYKSLGDKIISDQHFTARDFLEAETVFLQVLDFEIGSSNIAFLFLEELLLQFKGVAKIGEFVSFEACMDLMDLLYEKEETSILYRSPRSLATAILVAAYVITVPKQGWEFPVLHWVKFVTAFKEEDTVELVQDILKHVFEPC